MKKFIFDKLVDAENLCNLKQEQAKLQELISKKAHVVLFAPRNYGKTSLIKNVVINDFKKNNKNSFVFFVDFLGVRTLKMLSDRMATAFESALANTFPIKSLLSNAKDLITGVNPNISIDQATGTTTISLGFNLEKTALTIDQVFSSISKIAKIHSPLLVFDEFQDIALIDEAEALIRTSLQEIPDMPIIILGSQKELLYKMFSNPKSPLASWGQDMVIPPIDYKEYTKYINERFKIYNLNIDNELSQHFQNLLFRVPESINIVCQQIVDLFAAKQMTQVTHENIQQSIVEVLKNRSKRFMMDLYILSESEQTVVKNIAKQGQIKHPHAQDFVSAVSMTNKTIGRIFSRLLDSGVLDLDDDGYRIADPLFNYFLLLNYV